jgi:hypothetical protein
MASYYGDRARDVPSWDSFETGEDDEALDISEVRPLPSLIDPQYSMTPLDLSRRSQKSINGGIYAERP